MKFPPRLARFVTSQDYEQYTPMDQAAWRFIMRISKEFFKTHSTPIYAKGLELTGIPVDTIPRVSDMTKKLSKFGWKAVPVKGFIPPAVFMEFQARHILPISCDMRTLDHLGYTPAPDIIHEAAGHAPIIADRKYAKYLRSYATVAFKAIRSRYDRELYEAIRYLSDVKEAASSTPAEIREAEARLEATVKAGEHEIPSEAALMARMNWWTVEYGLVGSIKNPHIYGAGLLSSVGESYNCLSSNVKKVPFSIDCVTYSYDITRPQPQLFVAKNFEQLTRVLNQFAKGMAFMTGGVSGLEKAKASGLANTVELDSGLQISGVLTDHAPDGSFVRFTGPTQLSYRGKVLKNQTIKEHAHGFSTPIGTYQSIGTLRPGKHVELRYSSGIIVTGTVIELVKKGGKLLVIRFRDCRMTRGTEQLYDPAWGTFDCAMGKKVKSVFAGAADLDAYSVLDDRPPEIKTEVIQVSNEVKMKNPLNYAYAQVREIRERGPLELHQLESIFEQVQKIDSKDWLCAMEILELIHGIPGFKSLEDKIREHLAQMQEGRVDLAPTIRRGLAQIEHASSARSKRKSRSQRA